MLRKVKAIKMPPRAGACALVKVLTHSIAIGAMTVWNCSSITRS